MSSSAASPHASASMGARRESLGATPAGPAAPEDVPTVRTPGSEGGANPLSVAVRTLSGSRVNVLCQTTDSVRDLKEALSAVLNAPATMQRVIFLGRELADGMVLGSTQPRALRDGDTVHVMLRMPGGHGSYAAAPGNAPDLPYGRPGVYRSGPQSVSGAAGGLGPGQQAVVPAGNGQHVVVVNYAAMRLERTSSIHRGLGSVSFFIGMLYIFAGISEAAWSAIVIGVLMCAAGAAELRAGSDRTTRSAVVYTRLLVAVMASASLVLVLHWTLEEDANVVGAIVFAIFTPIVFCGTCGLYGHTHLENCRSRDRELAAGSVEVLAQWDAAQQGGGGGGGQPAVAAPAAVPDAAAAPPPPPAEAAPAPTASKPAAPRTGAGGYVEVDESVADVDDDGEGF